MSHGSSTVSADHLPNLPETEVIEPLVQCGVLYLGTVPPSAGRRGIDAIQEPFSRRYPVDGTNTVRGIDCVLSVFDNGLQLTFVREPHAVVFYPLSALVYCASLRFTTIENEQTSCIDWRFATLDSTVKNQRKHPPLFSVIVQRTQHVPGDECHCFLTKDDDAALALVQTISEVYQKLSPNVKQLRSPIFYQLDRYGRKISEITGAIYMSPATEDESLLKQIYEQDYTCSNSNQNYLLNPIFDGFFYRTETSIIEQWELWNDTDRSGTRPRPPASPFGQNEGLYHDDLTCELNKHLRHMDEDEQDIEKQSDSYSYASSTTSTDDLTQNHMQKQISNSHIQQSNSSLVKVPSTSFDPSESPPAFNTKTSQQVPIIIEKVIPNSFNVSSQLQQNSIVKQSQQQSYRNPIPNEQIANEGNRTIFVDVVNPNKINKQIQLQSHVPHLQKTHLRRKKPKTIPILDLQSFEYEFRKKKYKQRLASFNSSSNRNEDPDADDHLSTSDMLEIVDGYFEDYKGRKVSLNNDEAQVLMDHFKSSSKEKRRQKSISNSDHHFHPHSSFNAGSPIKYVERPAVRTPSKRSITSDNSVLVQDYVSNTYGTAKKKSELPQTPPPLINDEDTQQTDDANTHNVLNNDYISPLRYMQSSVNPLLLREYRHVFNRI